MQNDRRPVHVPRARVLMGVAALSLLGLPAAAASAGEAFPYVAYVIEADTYVRSGPGSQHYPTGQLSAGYAVEVHRHDGDGWCAIRPPEGSFSLAPAHQLRILDSRTAEVTAAGVVARVGSGLGDHRNAVQVMLERGEVVQLAELPTSGQPWVKIAPPAGEFRWIAARRLSRMPPMEIIPKITGAAAGMSSKWQSRAGGVEPAAEPALSEATQPGQAPFGHLQATAGAPAAAAPTGGNPAWRPDAPASAYPTGNSPAAPADGVNIVAGSPAGVQLAQHQEPASPASGAPTITAAEPAINTAQPRVRFEGLSAPTGPLDERLAEIQLRLSQTVVQPPALWQLGGLRTEAASLLAQEQSPQARDQLRDLLDRIATFEIIQGRYRGVPAAPVHQFAVAAAPPIAGSIAAASPTAGGAPAMTAPAPAEGMTGQSSEILARVRSDLGLDPTITPTPGGPTSAVAAAAPAATEALYDAVGTLKPVVSRRDQAPRYALVDDHGDVVTFVTATADMNLQPYVGKRIGVRGSRGFMPEYRRAHVTASRVTPLEEKLMR